MNKIQIDKIHLVVIIGGLAAMILLAGIASSNGSQFLKLVKIMT